MKCIENIFYLIFSTESNQKNMCIFSGECPFNVYIIGRIEYNVFWTLAQRHQQSVVWLVWSYYDRSINSLYSAHSTSHARCLLGFLTQGLKGAETRKPDTFTRCTLSLTSSPQNRLVRQFTLVHAANFHIPIWRIMSGYLRHVRGWRNGAGLDSLIVPMMSTRWISCVGNFRVLIVLMTSTKWMTPCCLKLLWNSLSLILKAEIASLLSMV